MEEGRALLREGELRPNARPATSVAIGVPVALGPDEASARRLAAWWLSTYVTRMGPLYPQMLGQRFGMQAAVDACRTDRRAAPARAPAAAEQLAHEVTLLGTYDGAGEAIAAWFAAGADSLQLVLPPGRPEAELAEILEVVARATAPPPDSLYIERRPS